jgi:TolA-binding protein
MQPAHAQGEHEKRKFSEIIAHVIHSWRYALWTILILGAAFLVFYFVWTQVNQKRAADATVAAEAAQALYSKWSSETNTESKTTLETQLTDALDKLVRDYPHQYGGQRGWFLRADYLFEKKEWDKSAQEYQELARRFPQSYLAPISLFNAGVCLEQTGNMDGALALYIRIADEYKDSFAAPRALFDAARISEQKNAFDQAQKTYERLGTDYPSSEWTKLAKNRVIALKVAGKIK